MQSDALNFLKSRLFFAVLSFCLTFSTITLRAEVQPRLYVPALTGPEPLARNVGTVLFLQIWQTLRQRDSKGRNFGSGTIVWDTDTLDTTTFENANFVAEGVRAQMIFWGTVSPYGDGAVVQSYLSIPPERTESTSPVGGPEVWSIAIADHKISMDLPQRAIEFDPIVLRANLIREYSLPRALRICDQKVRECNGPEVGDAITAEVFDGSWAYISDARGRRGWVYLPSLAEERTLVPDFVGALIRLHRGDYGGAVLLLTRILTTPSDIRPSARFEALLLRARALEQNSESGLPDALGALKIDPYAASAVKSVVMSELADSLRNGGPDTTTVNDIKEILMSKSVLFARNDEWVAGVCAALKTWHIGKICEPLYDKDR